MDVTVLRPIESPQKHKSVCRVIQRPLLLQKIMSLQKVGLKIGLDSRTIQRSIYLFNTSKMQRCVCFLSDFIQMSVMRNSLIILFKSFVYLVKLLKILDIAANLCTSRYIQLFLPMCQITFPDIFHSTSKMVADMVNANKLHFRPTNLFQGYSILFPNP